MSQPTEGPYTICHNCASTCPLGENPCPKCGAMVSPMAKVYGVPPSELRQRRAEEGGEPVTPAGMTKATGN